MQATDAGPTRRDVDEDQFATLFFGHAVRLVRLAALLGDDDPEDVVQESFAKLYAARSRLRAGDGDRDDRVVPYLNRIVVNEVRDRHRRRGVARRDAPRVAVRDVAQIAADPSDHSDVLAVLRTLPQRQREALVLRFWLDLPLAGVAEAMGVRIGTVKSQISRGLDAMKSGLGHQDALEVAR